MIYHSGHKYIWFLSSMSSNMAYQRILWFFWCIYMIFSPVWVLIRLNALPQWSQVYGFSPVWVLIWLIRESCDFSDVYYLSWSTRMLLCNFVIVIVRWRHRTDAALGARNKWGTISAIILAPPTNQIINEYYCNNITKTSLFTVILGSF